jgi:hypothetical protein
MRIAFVSRVASKGGHSLDELEDAFYACGPLSVCRGSASLRFAVADGASQGTYSRSWANLLVREFSAVNHATLLTACQEAERKWRDAVEQRRADRLRDGRPFAWYEEEKLLQGAFSTLLGIEIRAGRRRSALRWRATAAGDTCMFLVRGERLTLSFPLRHSREFTLTPCLLGTERPISQVDDARSLSGQLIRGDRLYLATDALAQWFLASTEKGDPPWVRLDAAIRSGAFGEWINRTRSVGELRNDDVTVLRVTVG